MRTRNHLALALGGSLILATITWAQMSGPPMQASGDAPVLNDAQIAHIAVTADNIDIAYAHLALALSENPATRRFAETMVSDHTAVNAKAGALASKLGVTPQDNEVSRQLLSQAKVKMDELSRKRGADFDRAYAANELAYHQAVNAALNETLIPGTRNPELRKLLQSAVPLFNAHQDHARRLNDAVHGGE